MACANTIASDQFAHPVGLKKNFCGSHTSCVEHEESSGTKQRLRKNTTHSEPLIELSNQRKHKEHVYFYFWFQTNWKQEIDVTYRRMSLIFDTVFLKP